MNPNHLSPGHLLQQRYSIQKSIGQGGFGITYLAYDQKLEQEVCIKELFVLVNSTRGPNMTVQSQNTGEFSFADFVQRFVQEARQLARFQHSNIVRVKDIFQENNTAYTVMEYVQGETLKQKVQREGAMSEKEALDLVHQLLDAVEEVHNVGLLHRDIKPENVLISQKGRLVLIDFGSAREFAEGLTSTQTAMITPGFAPIEQYSNRAKRGTFTDIYALGATMYYILTGEKPLPATDRVHEELLPPHKLNPKVSEQVSSAILLAMEMKSESRFQSVAELREGLQSIKQRPPETIKIESPGNDIVGSIAKNMILVEGGTFTMGVERNGLSRFFSTDRAHQVTLHAFYISKYQITQAQWVAVMGNNPSHFKNCKNCPVESVRWNDLQEFIRKLNQMTGKSYRLPTEAEWEYAARGGNKSSGYKYSGSNSIDQVAWYDGNSGGKTHPVGQLQPNELGLYDMSGNVWERCSDWYGAYSSTSQTNPKGPTSGSDRVYRGGSWYSASQYCRVSDRDLRPDYREDNLGFRLVSPQ